MQNLRFGIVGLGRLGKRHAENIVLKLPGVDLVSACSALEEEVAFATEELGVKQGFIDYYEMLDTAQIDAIVIVSPSDTHADFIVAAAQKGIHIFCEKPVDVSMNKIDEAKEAVEKAGVHCMIGFNRRFDPSFRKVWEDIRSGKIGKPELLTIISRDPAPPPLSYLSVSGGLFKDMTIHDFDMARYMVGKNVKEVFARAAVRVDPKIREVPDVDTAMITLVFEDDTLATIQNTRRCVYGYDQRLEIFGEKGMLQVQNPPLTHTTYYGERGSHAPRLNDFFMERYESAYVYEMELFRDMLLNDGPSPCSIEDGRQAFALAIAANQSLKEGRPITL